MNKHQEPSAFAKKLITLVAQFSKRIVFTFIFLFAVSMVTSYVLPIFFPDLQQNSIAIFNTVADITKYTILGYFGKAGFENWKKISGSINETETNYQEVG